ncbi:MAG TPA: hypothetical protein VF017_13820 [Thermoanaerobaculia bacterium]|nr:hypothetical protein [Thermoanaerobaculia bacterium]
MSEPPTSESPQVERLYVLFIHYVLREGKDWTPALDATIHLTPKAEARLEHDIRYLKELLSATGGWHGFAFLFLDIRWTEVLRQKSSRLEAALLGSQLANLQERLTDLVAGDVPIRIVTPVHLLQLLVILEHNLDQHDRGRVWKYLAGAQRRLLYDSSKVIEAVIRLVNLGRNVPILRFDDDVVFFPSRYSIRPDYERHLDDTRSSILALCHRYTELSRHPDVHYFSYSGCYLSPLRADAWLEGDLETSSTDSPYADFLDEGINGFATRIVQLAKLPIGTFDPQQDPARQLEDEEAQFDLPQVQQFLSSLWEIGANPFRQVISGAGLCLSDSAILDLPPFSNLTAFVMWIDDHLKFALHHELRHFGLPLEGERRPQLSKSEMPRIGRISEIWFRQRRHSHEDGSYKRPSLKDVLWHTSEYLPRLLRGCIFDAWLREDPNLKRSAELVGGDAWNVALERAQGSYARYFIRVLTEGPQPAQREELRKVLWEMALKRLGRACEIWGDKRFAGTFLHLFVVGGGHLDTRYRAWMEGATKADLALLPREFPAGLSVALERLPKTVPPHRAAADDEANGAVTFLLELIEDALDYVDLVRFWSSFVTAARYLLNTRPRRADVFWAFPAEYPARDRRERFADLNCPSLVCPLKPTLRAAGVADPLVEKPKSQGVTVAGQESAQPAKRAPRRRSRTQRERP